MLVRVVRLRVAWLGGVVRRPQAHVRLVAPQRQREQVDEGLRAPPVSAQALGLRSQRLPTRHSGVQTLLLLGGKGVACGAKEVGDRDETTIKIRLGKEPGHLQPVVVQVGAHIVVPARHVRGPRIGERFQSAMGDGGDEVGNLVAHRGRQGVVSCHALGNVRQAVHNRVFSKGARVGTA